MKSVYFLSGKRTPGGSFLGNFMQVPSPQLGAIAIRGAMAQAGISHQFIDKLYMGNVIQAGVGQAPARQAAIAAGLEVRTPCATVNKVCGSGMEAIILGAHSIMVGESECVVAGGMENMSMAPHLLMDSRTGIRFGNGQLKDAMQWDGLWDVYSNRAMGNCAEECAKKYHITRQVQDEYAVTSFKRAQKAQQDGFFKTEIEAVTVSSKKIVTSIIEDEGIFKANFEKIPQLRPAFEESGTITAANASSINDGAAAVVLAGENYRHQAKFRLISYANHAHEPTWFTTAPVESMRKCLKRAGLNLSQIDLFEINEAFAVVPLMAIQELGLDANRVNIYGGAISLGHPIGCSGARIVVTLMNALERSRGKYGMASICIGGGEALSLIIERF